MLENELDIWISEAKMRGKACRYFSSIRAYYTDVESDDEVMDILSRIALSHQLELRESEEEKEIIIWLCQIDSARQPVSMFG